MFSIFYSDHLKKLCAVSIPLMISSLSAMAMIFVDRLMLSQFSLDGHNIAVEVTNLGWAFQGGLSTLAGISTIFVSQYYGANQKHLLAKPVWQMIWLCLFSYIIFLPLAFYLPSVFYTHEIKQSYLFCIILFVPFQGIYAALSGFFIGQNKSALIMKVVLLGNICNFLLAYSFIFGIKGLFPSFGVLGAPIALIIALLLQVLVLFKFFWSSSVRNNSASKHYSFDPSLLATCVQIGFPSALFGMLEALGWSCFYSMMATLGTTHLTIAGVVQNVLILSFFFADGLGKAVATLVGNAIGAKQKEDIPKILQAAYLLMTLFAISLFILLWSFRKEIFQWFFSDLEEAEQAIFYPTLLFGLVNAVIYKYLEGIRLCIGGALTAGGDTKFLLMAGSCCIWMFMVLPIYFLVVRNDGSIEQALTLCSVYTLISACIFIGRFYYGNWLRNAGLIMESA